MIPKVIMGNASRDISSFNPKSATSHTVKVVPILDPKITPIPAFKVISSALIKDITKTEIRELELRTAVEIIPALMLLNKLSVDLRSNFLRGPSVNILKPFSRFSIPKSRMVIPTPMSIREGYRISKVAIAAQNARKNKFCFINI